jgi:hypothetical protein
MKTETSKPTETRVDCLDGLRDCLATLTALAALLEAAGLCTDTRALNVETLVQAIGHTGALMLAEAERAQAWLNQLDEEAQ